MGVFISIDSKTTVEASKLSTAIFIKRYDFSNIFLIFSSCKIGISGSKSLIIDLIISL